MTSPIGAFADPSGTQYGHFQSFSQQTQSSLPAIAPKPDFGTDYQEVIQQSPTQVLSNLTNRHDYKNHPDASLFTQSHYGHPRAGSIPRQIIPSPSHYNQSPNPSSSGGALSSLSVPQVRTSPDIAPGNNSAYRSVTVKSPDPQIAFQKTDELYPGDSPDSGNALSSMGTLQQSHQGSANYAYKSTPIRLRSHKSQTRLENLADVTDANFLQRSNINESYEYPSQPYTENLAPQHTVEHGLIPAAQREQYPQGHSDYDPHQVWEEDDELYDVSDGDVYMDEPGDNLELEPGSAKSKQVLVDVRNVVALQTVQQQRVRGFRPFADALDHENSLSTYQPTFQSTPLKDSKTALIFAHFVNVTAPSLSMFERHPANPALMFHGSSVPINQRHIWTCKSHCP